MTHRSFYMAVAGSLWLVLLIAGFASPISADTQIEGHIERLYLNHKQLRQIHDELHNKTVDAFQSSDQQSSYIRQANLFISESELICYYQWRLLSTRDHIMDKHKQDFHTRQIRDLEKAISESKQRALLLDLYGAYIKDGQTLELIEQAIGIIDGNVYLFDSLHKALLPWAHPPNRYHQRIDASENSPNSL